MEKLIFLLWRPKAQDPTQTRDILLNCCAQKLLDAGALKLTMNIDDPDSEVKSTAPVHLGEPICAQVSVWIDSIDVRKPCEEILQVEGFGLAGYLVDELVYTDYGDNQHSGPRDWPDGVPSPGLISVTLMERPKRLSHEEWVHRWHEKMSPVSEAVQPRQRYVRNVVICPVTPDAPPFEGIVEEVWPSAKHISNPFLFYCSDNLWQLVKNMAIMFWTVTRFLNLFRIRSRVMREYLLKS